MTLQAGLVLGRRYRIDGLLQETVRDSGHANLGLSAMVNAAETARQQGVDLYGEQGKRIMAAKYSGMHALRHFYASWCINRQADGGLGLPPKSVQERLGHSSIVITMDTYGHLFPRGDDGKELAAAETALLAGRNTDAT